MDGTTRKFAEAAGQIVEQWHKKYPLLVEFCAGADEVGLTKLYAVGDYQRVPVEKALEEILAGPMTLEEQGLAARLQRQRSKGKIIYKGKEARGCLGEYAPERRVTELGEEYDYQQYRIIDPQEGGKR